MIDMPVEVNWLKTKLRLSFTNGHLQKGRKIVTSTTAILSAKTCGSPCAPPMTKISGYCSSSGSDSDKDRWVWSVLTSRSRGGSISNFIFVVFSTAILSPLTNY